MLRNGPRNLAGRVEAAPVSARRPRRHHGRAARDRPERRPAQARARGGIGRRAWPACAPDQAERRDRAAARSARVASRVVRRFVQSRRAEDGISRAQAAAEAALVIMLDTHVAVALFEGRTGGLGLPARRAIDKDVVTISPAVLLEIELLFEIRRLREGAKVIAARLAEDLDIRVAGERFADVATEALALGFSRDPVDRLIVAHASLAKAALVTQDAMLRYRYPKSLS